uniref:Uncharacterized protein n=1 Tax=Sphenodon punctatus TaxID=8508 RepID=A0A8D0HEL9_SPHPU
MASTQVSIQGGASASAQIALVAGLALVAAVLGAVVYTYRRVRYTPLTPGISPRRWLPDHAALRLLLRRALGQTTSGESSPLLSGNVV